jgi:mRNA interferase HicA
VKRSAFIRHLTEQRCFLLREGSGHSIWENTVSNRFQTIPRHNELDNKTVRDICKRLSVPAPKG